MQYALISDIVSQIPKDTVVVWSLGHENFRKQVIRAVYPPGWKRIPQMAAWGYPLGELISAQLAFTPVTALIGRRTEFFDHLNGILEKVLVKPVIVSEQADTFEPKKIKDSVDDVQEQPLTAYVEPWRDDDGRLVSIAQYKTNGAMARIEIDPAFYRAKQHHTKEFRGFNADAFRMDQASMDTFIAALRKFKAAGVTLVVNEIEESPYMYENAMQREAYRRWMRENIKPRVEEYGFSYIQGPAKALGDADYFDYNHLNENGARRFGRGVGRALKATGMGAGR